MTVVDRFVQALSHGGAMRPTLQVVHSAETPLRAGYAKSIAENWFGARGAGGKPKASTSAHFMVDPVELVRLLSDNVVSYAVGPKANGFTLNWEQAGYARFSRAEWTTDDGMAQMRRLGAGLRERGEANGIPLRWASDQDIRNAARGIPGGICFHDDIRRVLGGTTHTDPLPNYPRDLLEQAWNDELKDDDMSIADIKTGTREALENDLKIRTRDGATLTLGQVLERVEANSTPSSVQAAVTKALWDTRVQGRNPFDWFIQGAADAAANEAKDAARDALILAALQQLAAGGGVDVDALLAQVKATMDASLAAADFPTGAQIEKAVFSAGQRAELERLRALVERMEAEQQAANAPAPAA